MASVREIKANLNRIINLNKMYHMESMHVNKTVDFLMERDKEVVSTFITDSRYPLTDIVVFVQKMLDDDEKDYAEQLSLWSEDHTDTFNYGIYIDHHLPRGFKALSYIREKQSIVECDNTFAVFVKNNSEIGFCIASVYPYNDQYEPVIEEL